MDVLIEINIGKEPNKSGVIAENLPEFIKQISVLPNIKVKGLMTIPPVSQIFKEQEMILKDLSSYLLTLVRKK